MTTKEIIKELDGFDAEEQNRLFAYLCRFRIRFFSPIHFGYWNPILHKKVII